MADGNQHPHDYIAALGRGMQPSDVRQANQRAVLTLIAIEPGISNAGLSRRAGLAPQSISAVLADLEKAQLIVRGKVLRGKRGQPATPLFLNPRGAFAVGAEIGWTHLRVVLLGLTGEVFAEYRRDYAYPDPQTIFDELGVAVRQVVASLAAREQPRLIGVGLAVPCGLGEVSAQPLPPGDQASLWATTDLAKAAAGATDLDLALFNDGYAGCCSEMIARSQAIPRSAVYLLLDAQVAGGVFSSNRLWEGGAGASANIGAMPVANGRGETHSVNELASLHGLQQRLYERGLGLDALEADPPHADLSEVLDPWIADAALALAQALINATAVIDYDVAIIEAGLPPHIRARIIDSTERHVWRLVGGGRKPPRIVAGHFGRSRIAEGAAQLRLYRRFISRDLQTMDA